MDLDRRKFLVTGAAAVVGTSLGCGSSPPAKRSDTTGWSTPPGITNGQKETLNKYVNAYAAFEEATDASLLQLKAQVDELTGRFYNKVFRNSEVYKKGFNVAFCQKDPAECYFEFKEGSKQRFDLSKVIIAFNAYAALCELQNKIDPEIAEKANLPSAPTERTFADFLNRRNSQLPKNRLSDKEMEATRWVSQIFDAASAFRDLKPQFGQGLRTDFTQLKKLLEDKRKYDVNSFRHSFTLTLKKVDDKEITQTFDIPSKAQLADLKRFFSEDSFGRGVIEELLTIDPPEERRSWQINHDKDITFMSEAVPIHIKITNPYFKKSRGAQASLP